MKQPTPHALMFIPEVAQACRAPVATVRSWLRDGRLRSFRLGRKRLIRREDLEAFLNRALLADPSSSGRRRPRRGAE